MKASAFDEVAFFRAIVESPARALLMVHFEDVGARRIYLTIDDVDVPIPCIDDYILTKRFGARPRDADDIRWLERFRSNQP